MLRLSNCSSGSQKIVSSFGQELDIMSSSDDAKRVANIIRAAFAGVTLGDGIGLRQANGLDDYADPRTLASLRQQDEKHDWQAISFEDLDRFYCSLPFFDAEGMRFHLPAYLVADLAGALLTVDIIFHLVSVSGVESRFDNLSAAQRNAVREYLLLRLSEGDREFDRSMIEAALSDFWRAERS